MINTDILSNIWKENWKLETKEWVNFENTFIQQTSGNENLWRVQLGETENHVLFFKQEVTLEETPTDRFLLQMYPKDSLYIKKCPGRKLAVTFPRGTVSHFKLPVGRGCGTAWAKWRDLQDKCGRLSVSQKPQFAVFNAHELGSNILRTLKEKGFMAPLFLTKSSQGILESGWLLWMKSNAPEEVDRTFDSVELVASSSLENKINKWLDSARRDVPKRVSRSPRKKGFKKPVVKLSRVVQRFGEGVPDGCTFNLSLTTNYPAEDPESSNVVVRGPTCCHVKSTSKKRNQKLNIFEYLCREMRSSEASYKTDSLEHQCTLQTSGLQTVKLVEPGKTSLETSGPFLVYGKKLAKSEAPFIRASHSGPLQSYEKLLAEFEKPVLKASDVVASRSTNKNRIDATKPPLKTFQSITVRTQKKKLIDSEKPSIDASHSSLLRNSMRNHDDSARDSPSAPVGGIKKKLVDPTNPPLEVSHSAPLRGPDKNPVDPEKPSLQTSRLVPNRSNKKNHTGSSKNELEAQSDSVENFVKSLGVTEKRSVEDKVPSLESIITLAAKKKTSSFVDFPKRLALPPPDLSSSGRFGSILRPFHYLLEPRKWRSKNPLLVPSSKSFKVSEANMKKR